MIDTVIFDLDGVIIDSEPVHQRNERAIVEQLGLQISDEKMRTYVGARPLKMWKDIIDTFHLDYTAEQLLDIERQKYYESIQVKNELALVDGILDLFSLLKDNGFHILLASSSGRNSINMILSHFKIEHWFEGTISSQDVQNHKPHPEPFLKAAAITKSDPANCVVIEDSTNGINAARQAGMYCIGFDSPTAPLKQDFSLANVVVGNLRDIDLNMIEKLYQEQ